MIVEAKPDTTTFGEQVDAFPVGVGLFANVHEGPGLSGSPVFLWLWGWGNGDERTGVTGWKPVLRS